jgi:multicomponent Na+:H+ antiporter subunit C
METVLCVVVGLFFAASIYLLLSRQLVRVLLGVSILSNAVNLLIFTSGRLTEAAPPVLATDGSGGPQIAHTAAAIRSAESALANLPGAPALTGHSAVDYLRVASEATGTEVASAAANPLPQALILTAIVIAFAIFAFLLVLTFRAYQILGTDDMNEMREAEPAPQSPPLGY